MKKRIDKRYFRNIVVDFENGINYGDALFHTVVRINYHPVCLIDDDKINDFYDDFIHLIDKYQL